MAKMKYENALKRIEKEIAKLEHHKLELREVKDKKVIYLNNPWGDDSIALIAYDQDGYRKDLFPLLNRIRLPEDLSAIYHIDSNKLEVIWTSYKLGKSSGEIFDRKFEFVFGGKSFDCHFTNSSDELISLASHAAYLQISKTQFRNLQSFSVYSNENAKTDSRWAERLGQPTSFFIHNISDDPKEWFDLIKHLNFYLSYYDNESPTIVIHDNEEANKATKIRYVEESFPDKIVSRQLNGILLALWTASFTHDITTRFLLYYRILEYVSGSYLQAKQRQELRRILSSPTAQHSIDKTLDSVAQIVRQDNTNEFDRFQKMFKDLVDHKKIWAEMASCGEIFCKKTSFDGGLVLDPLVSNVTDIKAFEPNGMTQLASSLRHIRHALAHGGEQQVGRLILPSNRNFDMLVPWTHLAMIAAADALLYEHLG